MVASGCVLPGQASVSLGNSVVCNVVGTQPILNVRGAIDSFRTAAGDHLLMTCVTSGTVVYDQLAELFSPLWPWDPHVAPDDRDMAPLLNWLTDQAAQVPPGCGGVLALPLYNGEGVFQQPQAFASLLGLRRGKITPAVLARASMEATSLIMRHGFDQMKQNGLGQVERVVLSGGGSQNALWPQIVADVLGMPVVMPQDAHEAATRGAAYLALHMVRQQAGDRQTLAELLAEKVRTSQPIQPRPENTKIYDAMMPALLAARDQLAPLYEHPWFKS